jgi:hypothetical protein
VKKLPLIGVLHNSHLPVLTVAEEPLYAIHCSYLYAKFIVLFGDVESEKLTNQVGVAIAKPLED